MWKTEILKWGTNLMPILQKYKYVFVILLAGLIMLYAGALRDKPEQEIKQETEIFGLENFKEDLQSKLSHIEGAGQVELLLSLEGSEETVYASNVRQSSTGDDNTSYENSLTVLSD